MRGVASVDADPSRPVAVTLVNAESVTIAISAIKADGSKEKLQTLVRRHGKGVLTSSGSLGPL